MAVPTPPVSLEPRLWVRRTFPLNRGETYEEQHLEVRQFVTQPAVVKAATSRTINLGNYESLRIEVGVEIPVYPGEEEVGLGQAAQMVSGFIMQEVADIRSHLEKGGTL